LLGSSEIFAPVGIAVWMYGWSGGLSMAAVWRQNIGCGRQKA
jgi:hypothetical protein